MLQLLNYILKRRRIKLYDNGKQIGRFFEKRLSKRITRKRFLNQYTYDMPHSWNRMKIECPNERIEYWKYLHGSNKFIQKISNHKRRAYERYIKWVVFHENDCDDCELKFN